jgi:hypothetical protein
MLGFIMDWFYNRIVDEFERRFEGGISLSFEDGFEDGF